MLYFDELVMMDGRILPMYVSPDTRADGALTTPAGVSWPPHEITANWRYQAIDPADEAANSIHPEMREARATVPLRSRMTVEELKRMRNEPNQHRLKLNLLFDRDRLHVSWELEQRQQSKDGTSF